MNPINLLLVDDEVRILRSLKILFRDTCEIFTATDAGLALGILKNHPIHVVISDQRMPGNSGVELLKQAKEISPNTVRILLTGYSDLDAIVDSINTGEVFRYINKPWVNEELKKVVMTAAAISQEAGLQGEAVKGPLPMDSNAKAGVLLLRDIRGISDQLTQVISKWYPLFHAHNLETAVKLLEKEPIGVMVADISGVSSNNILMIKILKREYPNLVTVAVTDNPDANAAVELINQGQVFRYLTEFSSNGFMHALTESMRYFFQCRKNPSRLRRHQLDALKRAEEVKVLNQFRARIPGIRQNLRLFQDRKAGIPRVR